MRKLINATNGFIIGFTLAALSTATASSLGTHIGDLRSGWLSLSGGTMTGQLILPQENDATSPELAFGDGNSGFYESADNTIAIAISNSGRYDISQFALGSTTTGAGRILQEAASGTVPGHTFKGDGDTGVGKAADDNVTLIAGGVQAFNSSTTASALPLSTTFSNAARVTDSAYLRFGDQNDTSITYNTGRLGWHYGVGTESRSMIICEHADAATTFGHGQQTNPTLYIHSADAGDTSQYLAITHDQTDAVLTPGSGDVKIAGNLNVTGTITGAGSTSFKSYSHTTGGTGSHYMAGYYAAPAADSNLNEGSTTQTLGTANHPYASHAILVAAAAGAAAGGSGAVTITVTGTSINDAGTRTGADSETIVSDITAMSTDAFYESAKKWIGQVTYTLDVGATGHTTYNADFNYGWAKYEDMGNRSFTLTDFECVGEAGATDAGFDIELLHHKSTGWTYHATAFVPGTAPLAQQTVIHSTESDITNGEYFAFKRASLSQAIDGTNSEGLIIRMTTGQANSINSIDCHIGNTF